MKNGFIKKTIVAALTGTALLAVMPMTASAAKTNEFVSPDKYSNETSNSTKKDKGEWIHKKDNWYFKINGDYVKGWLISDGNWYYFDSQGVMVHNTTITIKEKNYTFDNEGIYRQ